MGDETNIFTVNYLCANGNFLYRGHSVTGKNMRERWKMRMRRWTRWKQKGGIYSLPTLRNKERYHKKWLDKGGVSIVTVSLSDSGLYSIWRQQRSSFIEQGELISMHLISNTLCLSSSSSLSCFMSVCFRFSNHFVRTHFFFCKGTTAETGRHNGMVIEQL